MNFTESEIRDQLNILGYHSIPNDRLQEFKKDLEQLVIDEHGQADSEAFQTLTPNVSFGSQFSSDTSRFSLAPNPSKDVPSINFPVSAHGLSLEKGDDDLQSVSSDLSSIASSTRVIKRKVLRKRNGVKEISDESFLESDLEDVSALEKQLRDMRLIGNRSRHSIHSVRSCREEPSHSTRLRLCQRVRSKSAEPPSYRLPVDYHGPKSIIHARKSVYGLDRNRKTDRVSRYLQYKRGWEAQKAPGEKSHAGLRWNIREALQRNDPLTKVRPRVSARASVSACGRNTLQSGSMVVGHSAAH